MQKWILYALFFTAVPVAGALITKVLAGKGVSRGVNNFAVSTIGALAVLLYWMFLRS